MNDKLPEQQPHWLEMFGDTEERAQGRSLAQLLPERQTALHELERIGLPTTWDEDWRYTDLRQVRNTDWQPALSTRQVRPEDLADSFFDTTSETRLVFIDGRYAEPLSHVRNLPDGVCVTDLATALAQSLPVVNNHFARHAKTAEHAFRALNLALGEDAAVISIPAGTILDRPLHILHVSMAESDPTVRHPRNLIVVGENAQVQLIEQYITRGAGTALTNAVTELVAASSAIVEHTKLVRESDDSTHIATLHLHQERDSRVSARVLALGGRLVRNDINAVLAGPGADCNIEGLSVLTARQTADNHIRVEHTTPHCNSREMFRGILDERSHSVFCGRIVVHPDAQKTDAKQTNKVLLLSERAEADSKPQLEIYADDVKCTHGATIGQLDEEALFYLRSRGVGPEAARSLLTYAFAREGLVGISDDAIRERLDALVRDRLPHGAALTPSE